MQPGVSVCLPCSQHPTAAQTHTPSCSAAPLPRLCKDAGLYCKKFTTTDADLIFSSVSSSLPWVRSTLLSHPGPAPSTHQGLSAPPPRSSAVQAHTLCARAS